MASPPAFRNLQFEEMGRFAREAFGFPESIPIQLLPLGRRGSDRTFYRLTWNQTNSAILIHYDPRRVENTYYAGIALFLNEIGVPTPKLIRHDPVRCLIAVQDLGDTDLWSLRNRPWEIQKTLYQKTLSIIHRLHSFPQEDFPLERVRLMEDFGSDLYRWERDYFKDHFVKGVCGMEPEPSFLKDLEAELSSLAERLNRTKPSLIHRDLQSQNVMILEGEPFLIDFQGMRFGSPFYDLGSLLCDPYVGLNGNQRVELLLYYYRLSEQDLNWEEFQKRFWEASTQRLMQALGAYGFLSLKKGIKTFLDHIPPGIQNLQLASSQVSSLPILQGLIAEIQRTLEKKGKT